MINFLDFIKNNEITPNRSWKTPWENHLSPEKIDQIRKRVVDVGGYLTVIKSKQNLKDSTEVFTVAPIEFRISQNIKKSFDPKKIFNPGKMYRGI